MSWSVSLADIEKAAVPEAVKALFQAQSAYNHEPHRHVMDHLVDCAVAVAAHAPDDGRLGVSSWGHLNDDGTGSAELNITIGHAVPAAPAAAQPES